MKLRHLAATMLVFSGCAAQPTTVGQDTLLSNPTIPTADLQSLYSDQRWSSVEHRRYDGYVLMQASAGDDSSVKIERVIESYPDHSRDSMAVAFGSRVKVDASRVGLYLAPSVRVYAVFYSGPLNSHTALVFPVLQASAIPTRTSGHWNSVYVTGFDPSNWQEANGGVSVGESLTPDQRPSFVPMANSH